MIRSVSSEFFCVLDFPFLKSLSETLTNAYYKAIVDANIKKDIPLANYNTEVFSIKSSIDEAGAASNDAAFD